MTERIERDNCIVRDDGADRTVCADRADRPLHRVRYEEWLAEAAELQAELEAMDEAEIEDAFYRELAFGTGGLRGVLGAGTNRMNAYVVARASQGLADYVLGKPAQSAVDSAVMQGVNGSVDSDCKLRSTPSIAIAWDSRIGSEEFSRIAAEVFAANRIRVYMFSELMPTPCLSHAVRHLGCTAGIVITASHNPAEYNGYKVYGPDGCQITTEAAKEIQKRIDAHGYFHGIRHTQALVVPEQADKESEQTSGALASEKSESTAGNIEIIPEAVTDAYIEAVLGASVLYEDAADRDVTIVYTPLHGAGRKPVMRALTEAGFTDVRLVSSQAEPNGRFPTCPYPNPEDPAAMAEGLAACEKAGADLLIATDPDCDRCGIAVKTAAGEYQLLTGNETGLLLLDYICGQRMRHGKMPAHPVMIKTIVTTALAEKVAASYDVDTINVLTGFKFIGEMIGRMEAQGREADFVFGFEESYGFLSGTYARDKDAVNAALMIAEMYAWYRRRGMLLTERLEEIYEKFGRCRNTLDTLSFQGSNGMARMKRVMNALRGGITQLGGAAITGRTDYINGFDGLPPSDVIRFDLEDGSTVIIRPSGTEPKLKIYLSTAEETGLRQQIQMDLSRIL